jgi:hypothetical protein
MQNEILEILNTAESVTNSDFENDYTFQEIMEIYLELKDKIESKDDDFSLDLSAGDVRIISKTAIDEIWTESLIEQIKDCYELDNLPDFMEIDWNATAENCKVDGLGHHFNPYDGGEEETENYYIFRTN